MDEKVKELVEAVKDLFPIRKIKSKEGTRIQRAVEVLEYDEIEKSLYDLREAVNNGSTLAWFNDMDLSQNYSAINAALDAWFDLHRGDDDDE